MTVWLGLVLAILPAAGSVVSITVTGPTGCDPLVIGSAPSADELGFAFTFPAGEQIAFSSVDTTLSACPTVDLPTIVNKLVSVTNLGSVAIPGLYYVANGGSTPGIFSNFDGYVNGALAMAIDNVGINRPLVSESMTANGIFEPGETWQFIVQDYVAAVPVDSFYSPATVGGTDTLPSIIVPEPSGAALSLLGGLLLLRRRR